MWPPELWLRKRWGKEKRRYRGTGVLCIHHLAYGKMHRGGTFRLYDPPLKKRPTKNRHLGEKKRFRMTSIFLKMILSRIPRIAENISAPPSPTLPRSFCGTRGGQRGEASHAVSPLPPKDKNAKKIKFRLIQALGSVYSSNIISPLAGRRHSGRCD